MGSLTADGTSQAARLRPELDPAHVALDDRSAADLLAFARAYARQLAYVDETGQVQGDWQALFPPLDALEEAADFLRAPERYSAEQALAYARPPFALLLAFVDLLGLARAQLNGLTARHLDFFYREVLHLAGQPAQPDRLHLLATPDARTPRLRVPAGTAVRAGKDAAGQERRYRTETELIATPVQVAELRSLRADIQTIGLREASRRYLVNGTRAQAFVGMLRIALGSPNPGDALPVPILPGLPAQAPAGQPPAVIDFPTLQQADRIVGYVDTGLGLPLFDQFRQLVQLRRSRADNDGADWARIHTLLLAAGQRRDPAFVLPAAQPTDFHANLRAALGLSEPQYAALYNRLPEVASIEDAYGVLDQRADVQDFVRNELRLSLDEFRALVQARLRIEGEWGDIVRLVEAGGRRRNPALVLTPAQRALRDVDALLAAALDLSGWPVPVPPGIDGLAGAVQGIEAYVCMSAEQFRFITGVAERSLVLPPTLAADTPQREAEWAQVFAICSQAHEALVFRRRRERLQRAAAGGVTAGQPARALADMLGVVLGEPVTVDALARLAALGVGAPDLAWLQTVAATAPADAGRLDAAAWARAAGLLEVAQRNREGFVVGAAEQVRWHHLYAAADARAVTAAAVSAMAADGGGEPSDAEAARWKPFGSVAAALRREPVPPEVLGFGITSPLLALAEGSRTLTLTLGFDGDPVRFDAEALRRLLAPPDGQAVVASVLPWRVQLSGPEGWFEPQALQLGWNGPGMGGYPAVPSLDTSGLKVLTLRIVLGEQQPPVQAPDQAIHGITTPLPVLRLLLRAGWDDALQRQHSAWQALALLRLVRWRLAVAVSGLASLALRNDAGVLDPKKPFEPFGVQPASGARLSIAHAELVGKQLDSLGFRGQWMGAPASLATHYANYDGAPKSANFTLNVGLRDGSLFSAAPGPIALFGGADAPTALNLAPPLPNDVGRLLPEPPPGNDPGLWRRCWVWELAGDLQHSVYPARALRRSMDMAAAVAAGEKPKADAFVVNPPYTPKLKSLVVDYTASAEQAAVPLPGQRNTGWLLHLHPFGHELLQPVDGRTTGSGPPVEGRPAGSALPLLPAYTAEGELYIGLAGVVAPQRLSLLLQLAEGSADPDAPQLPLQVAVLSANRWCSLQDGPLQGSLLADGTRGLVNSGIVELVLPPVAPSTLLPGAAGDGPARYWLRLSRERATEGVCDVVALHPNAVVAVRDLAQPSVDDLSRPLPPLQASATEAPLAGLARLRQPYSSFGGKAAEQPAHFRTRVAERLRHRQRALTPWDYEHLVLERFPQLYKAKCLRSSDDGNAPGSLQLVVVPSIVHRVPFDPFAPRCSADLLRDIQAFLADKTPASARVRVTNAHFVSLKLRCGVRFMPGSDEGYCRARLNDDINRFLSAWAFDEGADLVIGGRVYANSIIDFIERRPYVDYIAGLRLFVGENGRYALVPEAPDYHAGVDRPDAVLVAAPSHDFDVIASTDYRVQAFGGIGNMRIELDFTVA